MKIGQSRRNDRPTGRLYSPAAGAALGAPRHNLRMASSDFAVIVIGGGPAGARTAELIARRGASVLLLEAEGPDVDNLCSGLLNAEGQHALGCELPAHVRR